MADTKELLQEVSRAVRKISGIDPSRPGNIKNVLVNEQAFKAYVTGLSESIADKKDKKNFEILAENTRVNILENSMYNINPYESLTLPILRIF